MREVGSGLEQLGVVLVAVILLTLCSGSGIAAEAPEPAWKTTAPLAAAGAPVLTLDEAVDTALVHHPNLRAARERIGAQQAVVDQQVSAYYPVVNWINQYRSNQVGATDRVAETYLSSANFSMTLYNFGKREGAVETARETLQAVGYNYDTVLDVVVLGVKQAYYGYLQAAAIVTVREETVRSRELLVRQAQGFYEVGTRARIDVVRAESNLYAAQADLIAAQNAVKIAWANLKNAMGLRELPERPVAEEATIPTIPYTLEAAREIAYVSRPELKSFEAQRRAQDQAIATARRGHLPDLVFDASYFGRRDTAPLHSAWSVQLSFVIPIFDGFRTTNRVEETLRNYHVIRAQEEQQRQLVALDVEQSYLRLVELDERIKANEAAAAAAKENLDLATGRYQVGVGSIIEVTDAQTLYTDAQTTYIRAIYDYRIAHAQLARAVGR